MNPVRKALNKEEITSFIRIDISKYPHLINSYHYFLFSFYTRGMNFYDMMKLTWDNVREDNIFYIRSKTKGNFTIKILEPVRNILDYYKVKGKTKYIFPILLRENLTPLQVENRKNKTLQKYNKDLKELARIAGIEKSISSYSVRHSYGTYLKFMGVSTDIISESMGHSNLNVTQAYLKSFDDEILDNANEVLLSLDD
ncbi:MAG: integrase catalytic domain-containing protein [Saprospiraceae bacterium]|nr:integrase catalytic domain-containing protein [Saprospiraceae bacterium]